jgi:hypothetical protein
VKRSTTPAGRVIVICVAVLGFALSATAQDKSKGEFSGGYEFLMYGLPANFPAGWYVDLAVNVKPKLLAVAGEIGGNWDNPFFYEAHHTVTVYRFLGGLRLLLPAREGKVVGFAQILVGGMRGSLSDGDSSAERAMARRYGVDFDRTNRVFVAGTGINVKPNDKIFVRVVVDTFYVHSEAQGATEMLRLAVGVVLPFGGK